MKSDLFNCSEREFSFLSGNELVRGTSINVTIEEIRWLLTPGKTKFKSKEKNKYALHGSAQNNNYIAILL